MKISGLALAVFAITACGGGTTTPGQGTCSATLTGALTGTYDCQAALGAYSSTDNKSNFGGSTTGNTFPDVAFAIAMAGDLHTGTFKDTDAGAIGIITVQGANNQFWTAEVGQSNSNPKQGSYTVNLTSIGNRVAGNAGAAYIGLKGNVTAVLAPVAGTGATGNVNLTATFQ